MFIVLKIARSYMEQEDWTDVSEIQFLNFDTVGKGVRKGNVEIVISISLPLHSVHQCLQ